MKNKTLLIGLGLLLVACGGGGGGGSSNNVGNSVSSDAQSSVHINQPPRSFLIQATEISKDAISVSWLNAGDPEGEALTYKVRANDLLVKENLTEKNITLERLEVGTSYKIVVEASDPQGQMTSSVFILPTRSDGGTLSLHETIVDKYNRHYVVFKPSNPEHKKLPVVIWYHGAGYRLPQFILRDYWITMAERDQFILIEPVAISDVFESFTYWNAGLGTHKDDVLLTTRAIGMLVEQGLVDEDRIYASGMSSGGHMAFYAAYKLPDKIAAVAPIAGSITLYTLYPSVSSPGVYDNFGFNKPMPICHIHGDADTIVNIRGGSWYASWANIRTKWIAANKVNPVPVTSYLPDINKSDGTTVAKYEYRGATPASDIDDYLIRGGGHSVPGIEGVANQDMNAFETIWQFFQKHKLSDPY